MRAIEREPIHSGPRDANSRSKCQSGYKDQLCQRQQKDPTVRAEYLPPSLFKYAAYLKRKRSAVSVGGQ